MRRSFWFATAAFAAVMLGTTLPTPLYPVYETRFGIAHSPNGRRRNRSLRLAPAFAQGVLSKLGI